MTSYLATFWVLNNFEFFLEYFDGWAKQRCISARGLRTSQLAGRLKNVLSHRVVEERPISPGGWRTSYLASRTKNVLSRFADEERRISALLRPDVAADTTFFNRPIRYDVLQPPGELRRCSTQPSILSLTRRQCEFGCELGNSGNHYSIWQILCITRYQTSLQFCKTNPGLWCGYMSKSAKPSQFLCHETSKNFFLEHTSRTRFFLIFISYIIRENSWTCETGFVIAF